jgi:hypothetical protein
MRHFACCLILAVITGIASAVTEARSQELTNTDFAKLAQNPVANLISVPFQNNTNFDVGPERGVQDILNIQPVVPFEANEQWNIISRTILPVVFNPSLGPVAGAANGLGDPQFNAFLFPK